MARFQREYCCDSPVFRLSLNACDAPVRRLAMADVPAMPYAAPLEAAVSIGTDEILVAARSLLAE